MGGKGRRGAQRLVVLETDGMANVNTKPDKGFKNNGKRKSHYRIFKNDPIRPSSYNEGDLMSTVRRICADEDDMTLGPGFSTPRKPVVVHTVAFGAIFEPTTSGGDQTKAVDLLQKISGVGRTDFPGSSSDAENGYKWCIGSLDDRKDKLREAFSRIMDDGISVSLIE
jgi:hypothetical protein